MHNSHPSIIELRRVSKAYPIYERPADRMKEAFHPLRRKYHHPFYALRDVSFSVTKGETIGIVGRNGSGKSTLLQILCRVLSPTDGEVYVGGRTAALLELGTGFDPEFSGRENVYLNAGILGMSREEVDRRFDEIVTFSGIGDFIEQPLKSYSSGMVVRLAFSVMINVDADILVIDEALAVGDEAFQRKCFGRLASFVERGRTLVFVSHSPQTVTQLCDRALLLEGGRLVIDAGAGEVIREYHRRIYSPGSKDAEMSAGDTPVENGNDAETGEESAFDPALYSQSALIYEQQGARIDNIRMLNRRDEAVNSLTVGGVYTLVYEVTFSADARRVVFGSMVKTVSGLELGGMVSHPLTAPMPHAASGSRVEVRFEFQCSLAPGFYFVNAGVVGQVDGKNGYLHRVVDALMLRVEPDNHLRFTGLVDLSAGRDPKINITPP